MSKEGSEMCEFETNRLHVGPWHEVANRLGVDLAQVVAELLTDATTVGLPASWQGEHSVETATAWINDRDVDASMLLVTESESQQPVGILILAEVPAPGSGVDLRIGYLFAESTWGQGLATELVSALIDWARTQTRVRTLTGGVDQENRASGRVLVKCGFELIDDAELGTLMYQFESSPGNEWDSYADGWDADHPTRGYASGAFASLERILQDSEMTLGAARVIDFGCGTGLLTERLVAAGATVEAVDTSTAMLAVVETKIAEQNWTDVRTSTSLPDEHEAFDLVVCSSVCSFLDDYPATVDQLVARLRDGGRLVQWDWERTDEGTHGLTRSEIREALTNAGLVHVTVSDAFSVSDGDQSMSTIMGHGQRRLDISQI